MEENTLMLKETLKQLFHFLTYGHEVFLEAGSVNAKGPPHSGMSTFHVTNTHI